MSQETIQTELNRRHQERVSNTINGAMSTFRALITEIDCMDDEELLILEKKLLDYGFKAKTDRQAALATELANSITHFMSNNRDKTL